LVFSSHLSCVKRTWSRPFLLSLITVVVHSACLDEPGRSGDSTSSVRLRIDCAEVAPYVNLEQAFYRATVGRRSRLGNLGCRDETAKTDIELQGIPPGSGSVVTVTIFEDSAPKLAGRSGWSMLPGGNPRVIEVRLLPSTEDPETIVGEDGGGGCGEGEPVDSGGG
jgi:hypothetical protein